MCVYTLNCERGIVAVVYTSSTDKLGRSAAIISGVIILYLENS